MKNLKNQSWTFMTKSAVETRFFGKKLLEKYPDQDIFCLYGNLGAGKTQLVCGMGEVLGIHGIKSPTYTIIREHRLKGRFLYHIDLYRVSCGEIGALGLEEIFQKKRKLVVIEWAEKLEKKLPKKRVDVYIEDRGGEERKFTILSS